MKRTDFASEVDLYMIGCMDTFKGMASDSLKQGELTRSRISKQAKMLEKYFKKVEDWFLNNEPDLVENLAVQYQGYHVAGRIDVVKDMGKRKGVFSDRDHVDAESIDVLSAYKSALTSVFNKYCPNKAGELIR